MYIIVTPTAEKHAGLDDLVMKCCLCVCPNCKQVGELVVCLSLCVCVCVCMRERERERKRGQEQVRASTLCQIGKSQAVTQGMWSFSLLPSAALKQVCLCVCVWEREIESGKQKWTRRESIGSLRVERKNKLGCVVLSQFPVKQHALTWTNAACASSQISEGVFCCHPARGHTNRISCSVLLTWAQTQFMHSPFDHYESWSTLPRREPCLFGLMHLIYFSITSLRIVSTLFPTDSNISSTRCEVATKTWLQTIKFISFCQLTYSTCPLLAF